MTKLHDGYYFLIEYQKRKDCLCQDDELDIETLYMGGVKLTIVDYYQLYMIIPYNSLRNKDFYDLSEKELHRFQQYMVSQIEIDSSKYDYYITVGVEDWLYDQLREERLKNEKLEKKKE